MARQQGALYHFYVRLHRKVKAGTDAVQCVPVARETGPFRAVVMLQHHRNPAVTAL